MTLTRREIAFILAAFFISRVVLFGVGSVAVSRLPSTDGAEYTHLLDGNPALDMAYRWDAGFYATIATFGYDWWNERRPADDMAFFPVYPVLVAGASGIASNGCLLSPYQSTCATIGGLIVSNGALLVSAFLLYALAKQRLGAGVAGRATLFLLITFNSIFLGTLYTESVFLMFCLLTFHLLQRRETFYWAVAVACVACLTRSIGVALVPALVYSVWVNGRTPARLLASLLPLSVFVAYIGFMGIYVGDPFAYFGAYQSTWGRASASPIEAFTVYFSGERVSWFGWWVSWIDLVFTGIYAALAVVVYRYERAWGLFAGAAILIPIATGTLLSMPRFGAIIFAFYIIAARWADRPVRLVPLLLGNAALWALFVTRFVTWRWIA